MSDNEGNNPEMYSANDGEDDKYADENGANYNFEVDDDVAGPS